MVASKTKKTSKYTYAERVLSAFSQAQKEHRKHSVHLATLRAHVRKIAKDKKDKLGPQWASWVGKAVKKLEEQGVLQPLDSSGYVGMTPEAKKALSCARRKFLPTAAGEASPAQEDAVWKNVTEHFSPTGHKRQRARSVSRNSCLRSVLDEDEGEEDSASMRGSPRAKKQRRVQSSAKSFEKPLSKMTKTELQTKVRELQRAKLTDQQVKAQLADREGQLREVQDELRQLKLTAQRARAVMQEEELTEIDEQEFQYEMNEEFTMPELPSFDVQTPRAGTPTGQGAGVTRTQSGSIIHDISMRPTPAPSSPDAEHDQRYQGRDEDPFVDQQREHLRTPESLPDRRTFETDEQQQNMTFNLENSIAERATLEDAVSRLQNEQDILKGTLDEEKLHAANFEREAERLQIVIMELESRGHDVQQHIADRDENITRLRNIVLEHEEAAAELNETLARQEASLNTVFAETETLLCSKNEAMARVQGMEREIAAARSDNRRLTEELGSSHRAAKSLEDRVTELLRTTEERQEELAEALSVAENEAGHGAILTQELLVMTESTKELEEELCKARNATTRLGGELEEALGCNGQLELDLGGSRNEVEELKSKMTWLEKREDELLLKLDARDSARQSLEHAVTTMKNAARAEQVKGQTTVLGLLEKIDGLQSVRDDEARGFASRVADIEVEMKDLHLKLRNAQEAQQNTLAAFNSSKDELADLRNGLISERSSCNMLRDELAAVQAQVSSLRVGKADDELTIATLRAVYEKWKRMERDWISELESAVCDFLCWLAADQNLYFIAFLYKKMK